MTSFHRYERDLIINNRELNYKGIFRFPELISTINKVISERGYEKNEKKSEELVTQDGKRTLIELRPFKQKTNYVMLMIKIRLILNSVTEIDQEVAGTTHKFSQGDILVVFDSWLLTDYYKRWGLQPLVFFLKGIINKYIYTWPLEGGLPGELKSDTAAIYAAIKKLLNSYKHEVDGKVSEQDVMQDVAKDIALEDN